MIIRFSKVKDVMTPRYAHEGDAGIDFYVPKGFSKVALLPHDRILIPSGIRVNLPANYALIAFNKSGVSTKKGLDVLACVVDSSYQGEIHLSLVNTSNDIITIEQDEKLVQFIVLDTPQHMLLQLENEKLYECETTRGAGGFGSTDGAKTGRFQCKEENISAKPQEAR